MPAKLRRDASAYDEFVRLDDVVIRSTSYAAHSLFRGTCAKPKP